jgi:hypothetical protein
LFAEERFAILPAAAGVAFSLQSAKSIDGSPRRSRHQPRLGIVDTLPIRLMPSKVCVLNDIFRFGSRAQHPICKAEQARAQQFECDVRPLLSHLLSSERVADADTVENVLMARGAP